MLIAVVLLAAMSCSGEAAPEVADSTPATVGSAEIDLRDLNLLLITIDTLRADRLGCYGDGDAETPRLDELARGGVRFENAYSHVPLTLPSHGTLFTGRYPFAHGVRNNGNYFLREDETTLAELMRGRGFHTRAAVATYILSGKFGLAQGFDHYDDALGSGELIRGFSSDVDADVVADGFETWLQEGGDEPFFAWLHFYDPHQPYAPPAPLDQRFAEDPYRGEVAFVDREIGGILDQLQARGLAEKTLIVVTSDHGEGFGEHGEVGHGILAYEEDLRIPLIVAAPGHLERRTVTERVGLVDLMPTLLELYGIETPAGVQGQGFAGLLAGADEEAARDVYFESMLGRDENNWAPLTGLITDQHKYISVPDRELYDLGQDPGETANVFAERKNVVRRVDRALRELLLSSQEADSARRERSGEDLAHLEALGYISSDAAQTASVIDPKRGIRLERELQKVRELVAAGALKEAEAGLDRLRADNEEVGVGSYYFLRHQVLAAKGDQAGAIVALEAGMARFPDSERFGFLLAHYQLGLGRADEAERLARAVLEQSPKFSQAIILLGRTAEQQGRVPEAIARYREARALEPRNVPLQQRLADALVRSSDIAGALEIYDGLADAGDLDGKAGELVKTAMLNSRVGRAERAEALFRRALALEPSGVHHFSFALVLAQGGKIGEATVQMETALGDYGHELGPQQVQLARAALEQWKNAQ